MAKLISDKYAQAFFELATELDKIDLFYEQAVFMKNVFEQNIEFINFINNPKINKEQKFETLQNIFKEEIDNNFYGLFNIILKKNREGEIVEVLGLFINKVEEFKNIVKAEVYSAEELTQEQIDKIKTVLEKDSNKKVNIVSFVSPELIGGIKVKMQGKVFDSTIKYKLKVLKNELNSIMLK